MKRRSVYNSKSIFLVLLVSFLTINYTSAQRNFYVSASGSDGNSGTSAASPWKTLAKVNSNNSNFRAGDIIHFKRGDVFYGKLEIKGRNGTASNPIVYKAYGTGNMPVIRASRRVTGWTRHNGKIWRANVAKINNARTPSLFLNGVAEQIGREPNYSNANGGYRVIKSHAGNYKSITEASALPYASDRFKNGEITIRTSDDLMKIERVTAHAGNRVEFTSVATTNATFNRIENGFGYFFQNHVNTLDQNGEWAHDIATGRLYLYSNTNPNGLQVEVPSHTSAIELKNSKYVQLQGLRFENGLDNVFSMNATQNITVTGCYFYNGNEYALIGFNLTNIQFTNNTINVSNDVGLRWEIASGITFTNNKVTNIGMRAGMANSVGFIPYTGVRIVSKAGSAPNVIEKNVVDKIGYHAVNFSGGNFKIRYNEVKNYCVVKDDGGGIYTVGNRNSNNSIYGNTVYNGFGAYRGAPTTRGPKTAGIYLDNDTQNHLIYENTVANVAGWGIMLNLSSKSTVRDNTVYNCGTGIVLSNYPNSFGIGGSTAKATNNTLLRNIFFSRKADQYSSAYNNPATSAGFNTFLGTLNRNYYCQPYFGGKQITARVGSNKQDYTLSQFKTAFPNYEANGKNAPVKFNSSANPNSIMRFEMNPTGTTKTVNLGSINYVDAKNNNYSGSVTIPAYSSLALLKGTGSTAPPPSSQLIANGTYFIESITSTQRMLSRPLESFNTVMRPAGNYDDQKWVFTHLGNNIYTIKNRANNRYLEVPFAVCSNSTQVATYTSAGSNHQKWKVVTNGNVYSLKPAHCLTQALDRNNGTLNTNVHTYSFGAANGNQKWKITPVSSAIILPQNGEEQLMDMVVYPNPAHDIAYISGVEVGSRIRVKDLQGRTVYSLTAAAQSERISLVHFKAGMYFISVNDKAPIKLIVK